MEVALCAFCASLDVETPNTIWYARSANSVVLVKIYITSVSDLKAHCCSLSSPCPSTKIWYVIGDQDHGRFWSLLSGSSVAIPLIIFTYLWHSTRIPPSFSLARASGRFPIQDFMILMAFYLRVACNSPATMWLIGVYMTSIGIPSLWIVYKTQTLADLHIVDLL